VPWPHIADQLNETIIRCVIQHDLRLDDRGRKRDASLLEELFRLSCRYVGQAPDTGLLAREAQRALQANVGTLRAQQYMRFLSESLLIRLIEPLEIRLKKSGARPKSAWSIMDCGPVGCKRSCRSRPMRWPRPIR
jgi:hypothetical protein